MATASIGGLVSGLDTSTMVTQLMALERAPQSRLKTQLSTERSALTSLQGLNATIAALATQAGDLAKPGAWSPVKVTSSSDAVTASPRTGAVPGSVTFTVAQTAQTHQLAYTGSAALTDDATGGSAVTLERPDGSAVTVDAGDGTLQGLVNGLNAAGTGVRASTVRLDDGTYRLRVTAAAAGSEGEFSLRRADGNPLLGGAVVTQGRDAAITIGGDTVTGKGGVFAGTVSGLDLTLGATATVGSTVEVSVTQDTAAAKSAAKALVDKVNEALTSLDSLTGYNSATSKAGALHGDAGARSLRNALLSAVYPPDGSSLASVGIQTDRYGKLVFDETTFDAAYAADPATVRDAFTAAGTTPGRTDGFAARVQAVAKAASDPVDGTLTSAVKSRDAGIDRLQDSIDAWDVRLELREQTLTRQFTALERALGQLQSQSSWLASQLSASSSSS